MRFSIGSALVRFLIIVSALFSFGMSGTESRAMVPTKEICERFAYQAALEYGVPYDVLVAIAETETGWTVSGKFGPWPWTINTKGVGKWVANRSELRDLAQANLDNGVTTFDVGCFQINYRWHGDNFASLDHMIDPATNARYAARFLSELYREFGNWVDAAAAYHSRTDVHAARYKKTFLKHLAKKRDTLKELGGPPVRVAKRTVDPEPNTFPFFQKGRSTPSLGSLVPVNATRAVSAFGGLVK